MKRIITILPLLILLALPSHAFAKISDVYIGGKAAFSAISSEATLNYDFARPSDDYKDDDYGAVGIGGVFGMTLAKMNSVNLRFEAEALIRFGKGKLKKESWGDTLEVHTNTSLLAGLYLDFPITHTVTPYAGVLLGANIFGYEAKSRVSGGWIKESDAGVTFQYGLGGGLAFKVNRKVTIDAGVRYLWSTDYNIDYDSKYNTDFDIDLNQNMLDVSLGFRYHF